MLTYENIFEIIVKEIPEFKSVYDEHILDYEELLPHVLMGDFTRFVVNMYEESKSTNENKYCFDVFLKALSIVEAAMNSIDINLQELISVSFLENVLGEELSNEIKLHLGESSLKELEKYEDFRGTRETPIKI